METGGLEASGEAEGPGSKGGPSQEEAFRGVSIGVGDTFREGSRGGVEDEGCERLGGNGNGPSRAVGHCFVGVGNSTEA